MVYRRIGRTASYDKCCCSAEAVAELYDLDFLIGWTCKLWGFVRGTDLARVSRRVTWQLRGPKGGHYDDSGLILIVIPSNTSSICQ